MAVHQQFSIAVHLMTALGYSPGGEVLSRELAVSVNTNPSFVRRILSTLSKAGLVHTTTGKAGTCSLRKDPKKISLLEVYHAVEAPKVFSLHHYPVQKHCPVSCQITSSMQNVLHRAQRAMEAQLKQVSLAEVIDDIRGTS